MVNINSANDLRGMILQLESRQAYEEKILREQMHLAYEGVKPLNLIKSTFKEIAASKGLKVNLLNTAVGISTGYLTKKLFEGVANSPIKKLLGTMLMFGVTKVVVENPEVVKSVGKSLFKICANLGNHIPAKHDYKK